MTQQHQKWIQLVKDKLSSEGMTQTHLARACGVKKPTISELLKYGKGSNRLKNRVCDVLGIDETWVDLGEQKGANMKKIKKAFEKIKDVIDDWLWSYTGLIISCTFLAIVGAILGSIIGVGVFLIIKLLLHKLFGLPFTVD